jgi:hypothetical protein
MEAIVGAVIAVLAVVGIAYTFGLGRGLVFRYETARAALGVAQSRLEFLSTLPSTSDSLRAGYASATTPFIHEGRTAGSEWWQVSSYNESVVSGPGTVVVRLRRVVVSVRWTSGSLADSLTLERLFPLP